MSRGSISTKLLRSAILCKIILSSQSSIILRSHIPLKKISFNTDPLTSPHQHEYPFWERWGCTHKPFTCPLFMLGIFILAQLSEFTCSVIHKIVYTAVKNYLPRLCNHKSRNEQRTVPHSKQYLVKAVE